jgi:hypothetical protein
LNDSDEGMIIFDTETQGVVKEQKRSLLRGF